MIDKKTFKQAISLPLEKAGFVYKSQSWYLEGQDTLIIVNLQKSDWDEMYYINIGFWLKGLGKVSFPALNHCHLYYRVERLFPKQRELILTACSLGESNLELLSSLSGFIEKELISFLKDCTQEQKMKDLLGNGSLDNGMVTKEARQYLSIE